MGYRAIDVCQYRGENKVVACARFRRDNFVKSDGGYNELGKEALRATQIIKHRE